MQIRIVKPGSEDWQKATTLVHERYNSVFDADVNPHPDCFIACFGPDEGGAQTQRMIACSGVTFSESRPRFFSEQYLDAPIESMIERGESKPIARNGIVEIGALASAEPLAGTELIRFLPIMIWCMGKRYVLCTATRQLRNLLHKNGIVFRPLGQAETKALSEQDIARWGTYYEHMPQVGYFCLAELTGTFTRSTGRYMFFKIGRAHV